MTRTLYALALCSAACGRLGFDTSPPSDALASTPADAPADACTLGAWETPMLDPFAQTNSAAVDWGVQITPDGLRVFFQSSRAGTSQGIFTAQRGSRDAPFSAATAIAAVNDTRYTARDPSPTPDLKELFFIIGDPNAGTSCIYVAPGDGTGNWSAPSKIADALCKPGTDSIKGVWINSTGTHLYYDLATNEANTEALVYVVTRALRSDSFANSNATRVHGVRNGMEYCSLSHDELTIYCEASRPITDKTTQLQAWQASRASTDADFGDARQTQLPAAKDLEGDPSITDDERTFVYASGNDSTAPADLKLVERRCR